MYSYADRIRAMQLYIKPGERLGATIRQLGYPTRSSLKDRYREYKRRHDLPTCHVRTKPWYSAEQKQTAVAHYLSHGRCLAEASKALGYPCRAALSAWIDEHDSDARRRVVGKAATSRSAQRKRADEMYHHRNWLNTTLEEFMRQVDSHIRWYNTHRIKLSLRALSPMEYDSAWELQHNQSKILSAPP